MKGLRVKFVFESCTNIPMELNKLDIKLQMKYKLKRIIFGAILVESTCK